jgi:hypothetical protein
MVSGKARVVEVVLRIPSHAEFLHYPLGAEVASAGERNDLR